MDLRSTSLVSPFSHSLQRNTEARNGQTTYIRVRAQWLLEFLHIRRPQDVDQYVVRELCTPAARERAQSTPTSTAERQCNLESEDGMSVFLRELHDDLGSRLRRLERLEEGFGGEEQVDLVVCVGLDAVVGEEGVLVGGWKGK